MKQALLLAALFFAGCAAVAPTPPFYRKRARQRVRFQVDPTDTRLWTLATQAAAAWRYALAADVSVTADGDIPLFWSPNIEQQPGCEPGPDRDPRAWASGCSADVGTPDAHILLTSDHPRSDDELYHDILHEMGHNLAGRGGHVDDPDLPLPNPNSVMTRYNSGHTLLTEDDVRYVCESYNSIQCPGPAGRLSLISLTPEEQAALPINAPPAE